MAANPSLPALPVNRIAAERGLDKILIDSPIEFGSSVNKDAFIAHLGISSGVSGGVTRRYISEGQTLIIPDECVMITRGPFRVDGELIIQGDGELFIF